MPWIGAAIGAGASLLGGAMGAKSNKAAADKAAAAQIESGKIAASAGAFRPVGMTTRFGTSDFTMGTDQYGTPIVTGATYNASPEIKSLQDRLSSLYTTSLGQAEQAQAAGAPLGAAGQGLFSLGQQYLAKSPEQAAQDYYNQQQSLLEPTRQREEQRLGASVFGKGRAGLNISGIGSPELYSLAQAREQQNAALAAQAEQAAQQRIGFGAGLFNTGAGMYQTQYGLQSQALSPFQSQFGLSQALEQAALQPLEIGANLGGRNVNTAGASALLQSGMGAANSQLLGGLAGTASLQNAIGQAGKQIGGMFNQPQQTSPFNYNTNTQQGQIDFANSFGYNGPSSPVYGQSYFGPSDSGLGTIT